MITEGILGARDGITRPLRLMNGTRDWEWIGLSDRLEKIAPRKNLLMCADQTLLFKDFNFLRPPSPYSPDRESLKRRADYSIGCNTRKLTPD